MDIDRFENALEPVVALARGDRIAECWMVKLAANRPPWTPSGIELRAGDRISIFSAGRASIAGAPDIWVGSHFALWMRIDIAGEIFRAPGCSNTFTAATGGQLYLCSLFPGDWADRHGALATSPHAYERVTGTLAVLVVRWRSDPLAGLERLARGASIGASVLRREADRLKHPPVTPAFAYRFDCPDRSIVFSGDTRPSKNLVELAKGADVLVHEVMHLPSIDQLIATEPNAKTLREHLLAAHTTCEEVGRVATEAGVKTLVLSHFVPGGYPFLKDEVWADAVRPHFTGNLIVAHDLQEI